MTLPQPGIGLTLATFAVVIGILVFVHEMGHYLVGRLFGIKADAFSIGFGREIAGWTDARGTRWRVGVVPVGGYVKFAGDADAASRPADATAAEPAERAAMFQFRPLWQRTLVILAGPLTNFVFAIAIFTGFFMIYGQSITPPVIDRVVAGSPAAQGGLLAGDRIVMLDGSAVDTFEDVVAAVTGNGGTPVVATVERDGAVRRVTVRPVLADRRDEFGGHYRVGQLGIVWRPPCHRAALAARRRRRRNPRGRTADHDDRGWSGAGDRRAPLGQRARRPGQDRADFGASGGARAAKPDPVRRLRLD